MHYNASISKFKFLNWLIAANRIFENLKSNKKTTSQSGLILGSRLYFSVKWLDQPTEEFPVLFYVDKCTVSTPENDSQFHIIEEGCLSKVDQINEYFNSDFEIQSFFYILNFI